MHVISIAKLKKYRLPGFGNFDIPLPTGVFLFVIIDEFRFYFISSSRKHTRWSCLRLWNKFLDKNKGR